MSLCKQSALTSIPLNFFLTKHYLLKTVQAKSHVNNRSLQIKGKISRIWLFFLEYGFFFFFGYMHMRWLLGSNFVLFMASHCEGTSLFLGQPMWDF
jgi:hypothetical protein